jgi:hypothetical protein
MGFFDAIKGAVNAATGGGAKVAIEFSPDVIAAGDTLSVKVSVTSTGAEMKSNGIFVDLRGHEKIEYSASDQQGKHRNRTDYANTLDEAFQIAPGIVIGANETKLFEGSVTVPSSAQPSYRGVRASHTWEIRGRVDTFGNDPDSGFRPIRVTAKD